MKALTLLALLGSLDREAVARLLKLPLVEQPKVQTTELALELHGTLVGGAYSAALITDTRSKATFTAFVGDALEDARVLEITRDTVIFERGARREELRLRWKPAGPVAAGVHLSLREVTTGPLPRIVPVPNGFKVYAIAEGSPLAKLGVQNGDIVRTVNGKPVDFSIAPLIHPGAQLTVGLERNGAPYTLAGQLD